MFRLIAQILSYIMLAWTVAPAVVYWQGGMSLDAMKLHMLLATIAWFIITPMWMGREPSRQ